jgi:membrane-associated protease RseP (regulator of RpoE activity)
MQNDIMKSFSAWLGTAALVLLSACAAQAAGELRDWSAPRDTTDRSADSVHTVAVRSPQANDYWLGLACVPVDAALRAQTNLPEGEGLLVEDLAENAPAAKAGVKQYDILVKVDQKPLGKVEDLVQAVEASGGKKLSLELLRGGKTIRIEVTPEKRPEDAHGRFAHGAPGGSEAERMLQWLERIQPGTGGRPTMRFRFYHPGTILPPDGGKREPMPENMSVTITKQGKEPAKITVHQADKTWEVTEGELGKLPADVRAHVERLLSRLARATPEGDDVITFVPRIPGPWSQEGGPGAAEQGRLEKRLDEMNRRIDAIRKLLDELRGKPSAAKDPHHQDRAEPQETPSENPPDKL